MTHRTTINIDLPADISCVGGGNVCVRQTGRQEEGDGCVSVQGRMKTPGFSQSPGLLSLFSTRCSDRSLFFFLRW